MQSTLGICGFHLWRFNLLPIKAEATDKKPEDTEGLLYTFLRALILCTKIYWVTTIYKELS